MTTVRQLSKQLSSLKKELQNKDVLVRAENGLMGKPMIKFVLIDPYNMDKTKKNVESIVIEP